MISPIFPQNSSITLTRFTDRGQDLVQRLSFYCSTLNNIIALNLIQVIFCFLDPNRGWFLIAWAVLSELYWKQIDVRKAYIKSHDIATLLHQSISTSECVSVNVCVYVVPWYSISCWVPPMENLFLIGLVDDNINFAAVSACSWS